MDQAVLVDDGERVGGGPIRAVPQGWNCAETVART